MAPLTAINTKTIPLQLVLLSPVPTSCQRNNPPKSRDNITATMASSHYRFRRPLKTIRHFYLAIICFLLLLLSVSSCSSSLPPTTISPPLENRISMTSFTSRQSNRPTQRSTTHMGPCHKRLDRRGTRRDRKHSSKAATSCFASCQWPITSREETSSSSSPFFPSLVQTRRGRHFFFHSHHGGRHGRFALGMVGLPREVHGGEFKDVAFPSRPSWKSSSSSMALSMAPMVRGGHVRNAALTSSTESYLDSLSRTGQNELGNGHLAGPYRNHHNLDENENGKEDGTQKENDSSNNNDGGDDGEARRTILLHTFRYRLQSQPQRHNDPRNHRSVAMEIPSFSSANVDSQNYYSATSNSPVPTNEHDRENNELVLMGLGMSQIQFALWVRYHLLSSSDVGFDILDAQSGVVDHISWTERTHHSERDHLRIITEHVTTQTVDWEKEWETHMATLRKFWKEGKLICEQTSLLSGVRARKRDRDASSTSSGDEEQESDVKERVQRNGESTHKEDEEMKRFKSDHFRSTLGSYADRLVDIVQDELSDVHFLHPNVVNGNANDASNNLYYSNGNVVPTKFGEVVGVFGKSENHSYPRTSTPIVDDSVPMWMRADGLRGWIEARYGVVKTRELMASSLLMRSEEEQLKIFQDFLDWFRSEFPYFHDKCDNCGISCNENPNPAQTENYNDSNPNSNTAPSDASSNTNDTTNNNNNSERQFETLHEEGDVSFLGYVYPSPNEILGNASRTELYRCRTCLSLTRFPRYNKALWVTTHQRGRCGEYSMLLYRMLRALGYEKVRWVVDWADHVWAEVWLGEEPVVNGNGYDSGRASRGGRWVHLDPCEAAVDNPLLYESWGKNQTYIIAFYVPSYVGDKAGRSGQSPISNSIPKNWKAAERLVHESLGVASQMHQQATSTVVEEDSVNNDSFPPIEDVTHRYTSDGIDVIEERRGIPGQTVEQAVHEVSKRLVCSLRKVIEM